MNINQPSIFFADVVSVNQRERSAVHGSGGGGITYEGTGFTTPITVRTTHKQWVEVWVKWPDEREDRLDFRGVDLLVREGHKLALLMSGNQIWAVRNFSTGATTTFISPERLVEPRKKFGLKRIIGCYFLMAFGLSLAGYMFPGQGDFAAEWMVISNVIALVGGVVLSVYVDRKYKRKWDLET